MLTLITGGSASGKSEYAEKLLSSCDVKNRIYLATMQSCDGECDARIQRHRKARAGRGFQTIERSHGLSNLIFPENSAVLLECLTNLAANEWFGINATQEQAYDEISAGIKTICRQAEHTIIVSGEVFADGRTYDEQTMNYINLLGRLNQEIARRADHVIEVVCSIPIYHKGGKA